MKQQKFYDALSCFDKTISLDPNYKNIHNTKGAILLELKKYDEALNSFNSAIQVNERHDKAHCNKGIVLFLLSRYDEALNSLNNAIVLNAKYDKALLYKGIVLNLLSRKTEAGTCFMESLKNSKDPLVLLSNVGKSLVGSGKYLEAIECLDKATDLFKENAYIWNLKGYAFERLGNKNQSSYCYDQTLKIAPADQYAKDAKARLFST